MSSISIKYNGDLTCSAIHTLSQTKIETDAAVEMGGQGKTFSPTDLVATGLGACIVTLMGIFAKNNNIPLTGTIVNIEKHMVDNPRRIDRIDVKINVPSFVDEKYRRALEVAAEQCPVRRSLSSAVNISVNIQYSDE